MAPVNRKKPLLPPSSESHDASNEDTSDDDPNSAHPNNLESPFQVELLRQSADDPTSDPENRQSVYVVRPVALWDSMAAYWAFDGKTSVDIPCTRPENT